MDSFAFCWLNAQACEPASNRKTGDSQMKGLRAITIMVCAALPGASPFAAAQSEQGSKNPIFTADAPANPSSGATVKQSAFTLHEPVEIPGTALKPGRYTIKLAGAETRSNVLDIFNTVQIWNSDQTHLYATCYSMPDYNLPPSSKPLFTFYDRGRNAPRAMRTWYHPAAGYGEQFVYPNAQAAEIAQSAHLGVLSLPAEIPAAVKATPRGWGQIARTDSSVPARLPKTASSLPLFVSLGLLCLVAGLALRAGSRWVSEASALRVRQPRLALEPPSCVPAEAVMVMKEPAFTGVESRAAPAGSTRYVSLASIGLLSLGTAIALRAFTNGGQRYRRLR
jgi:hypothetical protein